MVSAAGSNSSSFGGSRPPSDSPGDSAASQSLGQSSPTTSISLGDEMQAAETTNRQPPESPAEAEAPGQQSSGASSQVCDSGPDGELRRPADGAPGESPQQEQQQQQQSPPVEIRLLVRRREAGALIGKRGANIKRLRDTFRGSMFSIPDTGNGPERIVCIATSAHSLDAILTDLSRLFMEKSPENDEQIELKLLIHSSHAGSIIGVGGQSIKRLRNDSKAAIKIYEMCCPLSNERVCAIKAKPPIVVSTIQLIHSILSENPVKGTIKPYDALHFDLSLVDKYGGYLPEEAAQAPLELVASHGHHFEPFAFGRQLHEPTGYLMKPYSVWRSPDYKLSHRANTQQEPADEKGDPLSTKRSSQSAQASDDLSSPDAQNTATSSPKQSSASRRAPDSSEHEPGHAHMKAHNSAASRQQAVRYHPYATLANGQVAFLTQAALDRQLMAAGHLPLGAPSAGSPSGAGAMVYPRGLHFAAGHHHHHHHHPTAAVQQHRGGAGAQFISVPAASLYSSAPNERCRHDRPCLCMFLPMAPEVVPAGPFVQLGAKSFAYPRQNSGYGFKKK